MPDDKSYLSREEFLQMALQMLEWTSRQYVLVLAQADVVRPHDPKLASIIEENAAAMCKLRDYLWERVETRVAAEWLSRHWSRKLPAVEKVLGLVGSSETAERETLTDRAKKFGDLVRDLVAVASSMSWVDAIYIEDGYSMHARPVVKFLSWSEEFASPHRDEMGLLLAPLIEHHGFHYEVDFHEGQESFIDDRISEKVLVRYFDGSEHREITNVLVFRKRLRDHALGSSKWPSTPTPSPPSSRS
jgi:hypothetical protein